MDTSTQIFEPPNFPLPGIADDIDRKALAARLLELARHLKPEAERPAGIELSDLRLAQLRTLLFGREIELLNKLNDVAEDPEKFAAAVGRVLATAIAGTADDVRLGQVLEPALEKAIYPLIVPAIRKSIGERIDQTFQSLNESLKHSFTWRGLRWRWEAWRSGLPFADVVLKHTLVYRVEHVFLIHRHTGLLISHVMAENAASQDPQLVSSMLGAIQDFVQDSFTGVDKQGLDTLRLGELRLWSEAGPFAMLVAVIRGNPPEELHDILRGVLARIHSERPTALQTFDGDSSGFKDIEGQLSECVKLGQEAPSSGLPGLPLLVRLVVMLLLLAAAIWGFVWWRDARQWDDYLTRLRAQPGIVITAAGRRDGKFEVTGLLDPLATKPREVLRDAGIDPTRVVANWAPYQGLDPELILRRLRATLLPPPSVTLSIVNGRIVAKGSASDRWLELAQTAEGLLPAGSPDFDFSGVRNIDQEDERQWTNYLAKLRTEPGIVVTNSDLRDGKFVITGLRDPLAADPQNVLREVGIDPARVASSWAPYQGLDPEIVLKRLETALDPPPTVALTIQGGRIVAKGSAPDRWLDRARAAERMLPAGSPAFDLSGVSNVDEEDDHLWEEYVAKLRAEPGIVITASGHKDAKFVITGLRDPLAADPQNVLREVGIDPARVASSWAPYQGLDPQFVLKRLQSSLNPPPSVSLAIEENRIVARGSAQARWLDRAYIAQRMLPAGAPEFDLSGVENVDEAALLQVREAIAKVRQKIQSHTILFDFGVPLPAGGQDRILDQVAGELRELAKLSSPLLRTKVALTGNSDAAGEGTFNLALSVARAEAVRAMLLKRGVDPDLLAVRGAGTLEPVSPGDTQAARTANRRVWFSVTVQEQQ